MDHSRPPYFFLKKYAIMGFTIAQIILLTIFIILAAIAMSTVHSKGPESLTQAVLIYMIVTFVIAILIQLLGLFGAWKEHFCLSCAYAILSTLSFLGSIYSSIRTPVYWLSTVISLLVTIAAILFTIDLRRMRLAGGGQVNRGQPAMY